MDENQTQPDTQQPATPGGIEAAKDTVQTVSQPAVPMLSLEEAKSFLEEDKTKRERECNAAILTVLQVNRCVLIPILTFEGEKIRTGYAIQALG